MQTSSVRRMGSIAKFQWNLGHESGTISVRPVAGSEWCPPGEIRTRPGSHQTNSEAGFCADDLRET